MIELKSIEFQDSTLSGAGFYEVGCEGFIGTKGGDGFYRKDRISRVQFRRIETNAIKVMITREVIKSLNCEEGTWKTEGETRREVFITSLLYFAILKEEGKEVEGRE